MTMTLNKLLSPERGHNESRPNYMKRRRYGNSRVARWLRGELIWNSDTQGTYGRAKQKMVAARPSLRDSWVERTPLVEVVGGR